MNWLDQRLKSIGCTSCIGVAISIDAETDTFTLQGYGEQLKHAENEIERLQRLLNAATRLLEGGNAEIEWGGTPRDHPERGGGYWLRKAYVGESMEDVIAAEAKEE